MDELQIEEDYRRGEEQFFLSSLKNRELLHAPNGNMTLEQALFSVAEECAGE